MGFGLSIRHGETGVLAPYGAPQACIGAVVSLRREPQALPRIWRQAQAHVAACDWQRVVDKVCRAANLGGGRWHHRIGTH